MIVNKPVIWSGIFNCLLKLITGMFQHMHFPLLWPYGSLTCTQSTYERSNSNYLRHLYNVFYIQKSARFLAGYNPVFSTPSKREHQEPSRTSLRAHHSQTLPWQKEQLHKLLSPALLLCARLQELLHSRYFSLPGVWVWILNTIPESI